MAKKVVIARGVLSRRRCRRRLDAMMARVQARSTEVVDDEALEALLASFGPRHELRRGGLEGRSREKELVAFGLMGEGRLFPGYSWRELRSGRRELLHNRVLCQTAVEIQSAVGCPYDCTYCPYSAFVCVRLDTERFVERVTRLVQARRSQRLYKLNNRTDTLALEPEYGLAAQLVERFAKLGGPRSGPCLMLYAKGTEVDHLLDLEHGGRTVACFTLTPASLATLLEPGAPPPDRRIAALGRLSRAGYPVRVRLSPVVPLRGWQQAYRVLIRQLVQQAVPEMITLWTLSMVDLQELFDIVPERALDEQAVARARRAGARMRGMKGAPFPPGVRAVLYREIAAMIREASPGTHVALCLETAEVWDRVFPHRSAGPCTRKILCNCGPGATPEAVRRQVSPPACTETL